jgi:xanthine/CO dehydrogenase XdhC/CoxF family maturation factor
MAQGEPRRCRSGEPRQSVRITDETPRRRLSCGGDIEIFIQVLDPEEGARIAAAVRDHERLSVTTTLSGADAGAKVWRGEAH